MVLMRQGLDRNVLKSLDPSRSTIKSIIKSAHLERAMETVPRLIPASAVRLIRGVRHDLNRSVLVSGWCRPVVAVRLRIDDRTDLIAVDRTSKTDPAPIAVDTHPKIAVP